MMNKTSFVTNVTAILREFLVTCLTCDKTMKRMLTLKFDMGKYSSLERKHNMRNAEIKQNKPLYMQDLPLATPTKMYMCVLQHRCAERSI